jgi:hypothetical protein
MTQGSGWPQQTPTGSQHRSENLAVATDSHLVLPIFVGCAIALGSTEKPAQMTRLKLPRRTFFLVLAFFDGPAILAAPNLTVTPLVDSQKIELTLDMDGNCPPTLFVALHRFQGNSQQLGKSFLGFPQLRP